MIAIYVVITRSYWQSLLQQAGGVYFLKFFFKKAKIVLIISESEVTLWNLI